MAEMKLSPPWNTFVHELHALFDEDKDVRIEYDDGSYEVKLYVVGQEKADALTELLPSTRIYGNVGLNVTVIPANKLEKSNATLIEKAFNDNPVMKGVLVKKTLLGEFKYAVFRKEVVQFFNDDMTDPGGMESTLFEDIARDVFGESDVFFCTDSSVDEWE